ncbi:hypothetical protein BOTBODRAFT_176166 [Botryobasidium botryosum FD-172 SS1]|uniref:Uncharacterized protein n=1 Tax=Botryobasidium botryosum (strain FD-172 SS1) TaxID=930990 RepID=A0A067MLI6_BOTB1|nr:hypothetical protein BOTBODRAFT_176166 [Botryobasidium botryosum FD-172 SS1]
MSEGDLPSGGDAQLCNLGESSTSLPSSGAFIVAKPEPVKWTFAKAPPFPQKNLVKTQASDARKGFSMKTALGGLRAAVSSSPRDNLAGLHFPQKPLPSLNLHSTNGSTSSNAESSTSILPVQGSMEKLYHGRNSTAQQSGKMLYPFKQKHTPVSPPSPDSTLSEDGDETRPTQLSPPRAAKADLFSVPSSESPTSHDKELFASPPSPRHANNMLPTPQSRPSKSLQDRLRDRRQPDGHSPSPQITPFSQEPISKQSATFPRSSSVVKSTLQPAYIPLEKPSSNIALGGTHEDMSVDLADGALRSTARSSMGIGARASSETTETASRAGSVGSEQRTGEVLYAQFMRSQDSWKHVGEAMKEEINVLQSQVQDLTRRNTDLSTQLKTSKERAVTNLKKAQASLEDMKRQFDSLKQKPKSDVTVEFAVDIAETRKMAQEACKKIEPLLNGELFLTQRQSLKTIQEEARLAQVECANRQEIIDLLREQLNTFMGDLVEQKDRANTLEIAHERDTEALPSPNLDSDRLAGIQEKHVNELTHANQEESEKLAIYIKELEAKLGQSTTSINDLAAQVALRERTNDEQSQTIKHLEGYVQEARQQLETLHLSQATLAAKLELVPALQLELSSLRESEREKSEKLAVQETRYKNLQDAYTVLEAIRKSLQVQCDREADAAREHASSLQRQIDAEKEARQKATTVEQSLVAVQKELGEARRARLTAEEKYEGARDSYEKLQQRVMEDAKTAGDGLLDGKAQADSALQTLVESHRAEMTSLRANLHKTETERDGLLRSSAEISAQIAKLEEQVRKSEEAATRLDRTSKKQVAALSEERDRVVQELDQARTRHQEELADSGLHLQKAQEKIEELENRAATLADRHKEQRDLSPQEWSLIRAIMANCRTSVEQKLVEKTNEIRRRDITINGLHARIKSLESALAKQLDTEAKVKANAGIPSHSIINPKGWMSSSPLEKQTQAPPPTSMSKEILTVPSSPLSAPPHTPPRAGSPPPVSRKSFGLLNREPSSEISEIIDNFFDKPTPPAATKDADANKSEASAPEPARALKRARITTRASASATVAAAEPAPSKQPDASPSKSTKTKRKARR